MQKYYMYYGAQAYEFERPPINIKPSTNADVSVRRYNLKTKPSVNSTNIKPSKTKAVKE